MHEKNQTDLWLFADFVNFKLTFGLQNQQGVASIPYSLIHTQQFKSEKMQRNKKHLPSAHLHLVQLAHKPQQRHCRMPSGIMKWTANCEDPRYAGAASRVTHVSI